MNVIRFAVAFPAFPIAFCARNLKYGFAGAQASLVVQDLSRKGGEDKMSDRVFVFSLGFLTVYVNGPFDKHIVFINVRPSKADELTGAQPSEYLKAIRIDIIVEGGFSPKDSRIGRKEHGNIGGLKNLFFPQSCSLRYRQVLGK